MFYIKNFKSIIQYLHLANNYNKYYLIINEETEEDLKVIIEHLDKNKMNPEFDRKNLFIVCSNYKQVAWCKKYKFQFQLNKTIDLTNNYEPKIINKPSWIPENQTVFLDYYKDDTIQIIHIEGFDQHWNIIPSLNNNIFTFVTAPSFLNNYNYRISLNTLYTLNKNYNKKNIIWLSPDLDGILLAYEYGFNAILCNQNCWLDYTQYNTSNEDKLYDIVISGRPELSKRLHLVSNIEKKAYIKEDSYKTTDLFDHTSLNCTFVNNYKLDSTEILEIYNKSYTGGVFSEKDGTVNASSEYLLSGLPVVSTESKGGRHTWYTLNNSIIVNDNPDDIKTAVETCISNLQNNIFNSENIRSEHIKLSDSMRSNFNKYVQNIFDAYNINNNAEEYLNQNFIHKMKKKYKLNDCVSLLLKK